MSWDRLRLVVGSYYYLFRFWHTRSSRGNAPDNTGDKDAGDKTYTVSLKLEPKSKIIFF
jgi:hypothetical protein